MYSFNSRVRYSEVDCEEKLTLNSILNYFQDVSTFHSEDLGVGTGYLAERNIGWVLSYWQIIVDHYPRLGENIKICTHPYDFKGFMGFRNFLLENEEGRALAYANSIWTFLNLETGRPERIPQELVTTYTMEPKITMDYEPRKIELPQVGDAKESFSVRSFQIDSNHHVNNGQYIQMALEYLPEDFTIHQMRAEYKKAALLQDCIQPLLYHDNNKYIVSLNDDCGQPYAVVEFK